MISFDLFKKDDLSLLLNSFDTDFLQMPMKRPSKSLLEFIPNGFRPEKLARFQLDKVYVNALYSRESSASDYLLNELLRNFEEYGIDEYMKDKIGEVFEGRISSVLEYGFYVTLPNTIEGFVHIRTLPEGEYDYTEPSVLIEKFSGTEYKIGNTVNVICSAVNVNDGIIDFVIDEEE